MVTIRKAAEQFVATLNAYPRSMIEQLMDDHPDDWHEVTAPAVFDRVYIYNNGKWGKIVKAEDEEYTIRLDEEDVDDSQTEIVLIEDDFEVFREEGLPMWGTLWSFGDSSFDWWLANENGVLFMSECGFRIYYHDEWGYFFGIDGAGYSFYEEHWIPLYKALELRWHDEETV